jgi:hypothetical protein
MEETPVVREDILQQWLERYPDLLPGDQIDPDDPPRWLLVKREMPVPDVAAGSGRWSLDHLLLDQHGVPTFLECKRASDTRGRREVVAQMLDYAANGVEYWGSDALRQAATETARKRNQSLDDLVATLVGNADPAAIEAYWRQVDDNLRSGRVRLVFVAEETTKELRRLVEFLNAKLADVEVLAVEIRQFVGGGQAAVVPRVIGMTEAARAVEGRPEPPRPEPWTAEALLGKLEASNRLADLARVRRLLTWAEGAGFSLRGGRGARYGSLYLRLPTAGGAIEPFSVYEGTRASSVSVYVQQVSSGLARESEREELRRRLAQLGFDVPPDAQYPGIYLPPAEDGAKWKALTTTFDWIVERLVSSTGDVRRGAPTSPDPRRDSEEMR